MKQQFLVQDSVMPYSVEVLHILKSWKKGNRHNPSSSSHKSDANVLLLDLPSDVTIYHIVMEAAP